MGRSKSEDSRLETARIRCKPKHKLEIEKAMYALREKLEKENK